MQILNSQDACFKDSLEKLINKSRIQNENVSGTVTDILKQVMIEGNSALINFTEQFDKISLKSASIMLSKKEIALACKQVSDQQKEALDLAASRIRDFHKRQLPRDEYWIDDSLVEMGWKWQPIERIGIYVPGGTAAYPSSVLMNAIPATIAGAKELVMVSPTPRKQLNPLVIYAAEICGVKEVYRIGGAQAIAALTYGTETIRPVDKIVGPGNVFVAEAKRQVFGMVGIDMIAGPSEVVIIADEDNNPNWISADLLSQAEHDMHAQSILITTSEIFAKQVVKCLDADIKGLIRKKIASESLKNNGAIILVENFEVATTISNRLAPEHLQLCVKDPKTLLSEIKNAGSIFLGSHTPEALGDYVVGTNHVLPTGKSARFASGLSVLDFMKRSFISRVAPNRALNLYESTSILADAEGLGAHKLSVDMRMSDLKNHKNDG